MAFRQSNDSASERRWQDWIAEHRRTLEAIGLPSCIELDHAIWDWFVEWGEIEDFRFPDVVPTGFSFSSLGREQKKALLRFLETHAGTEFVPESPALRGFLWHSLNPEAS